MAISETEVIIVTVMYALTMLAAIVGNSILIYIVWKKPEVRSLTSSMFVNMAVADLLVALFMMPLSIVQLYTGGQWKISGVPADFTCRVFILISYATLMASILCLIFMAIDRFYAVVRPLNIQSVWFRKAKFVTPFIWLMSIALMAIVPVVYKWNPDGSFCEFHVNVVGNQTETFRGIFLYIFMISYVIPLAIISPLYAKAARKIWFNRAPGNPLTKNQQQQQEVTKRKVIRMLIIIVVVFAFCWLPAQAIHLFWAITTFRVLMPLIVMHLGFWLAHANSAINPWLYIALSTNIRLAFTRIVIIRKSQERPSRSSEKTSLTKAITNESECESRL